MAKQVSSDVMQELTNKIQDIVNNYCWNLEEYTPEEIEQLFDGTSEDIDYYSSIIKDTTTSKNFLWSSSKVVEEISKAIIEANEYTDSLLKNISSISLKYVETLPTTGESNVIYILKKTDEASNDTLNLYNDGSWTSIGEFTISLDDFYTRDKADELLDKKANKTEVISNDKILQTLDSTTNSADTILSTNGLQSELDKKIDKTSIVTSIDENSTDDTVPSAKTIYDNAIKDKNIKTYTTLEQLSLASGCGVGDIFNALPNNSYLEIGVHSSADQGLYAITDVPSGYKFGILTIRKISLYRFDIQYKISNGGSVIDNIMFIGQLKGSDGTGLTWSRVCTTSISDTSGTGTLVHKNGSTVVKGTVTYEVINGICYCTFLSVAPNLTGGKICSVTGVPKSKRLACGMLAQNGATSGSMSIGENSNIIYVYKSSASSGSGSFSYPVAE